ncbi:hypothetical protein MYP_2897 [Sporocytophaga myxococcoides]|uniref:Crp/Fnr family transcriptional regulator n=1 Tax=Sporocytophaga myxococcoides TaxID=153721 RepID=A0A098LHQ7_9BACT|nr:Crp/Fnr family transcriptional regulator [Sporocytophaga myxococcoides]GAL85668.1 hypothetical protein MYP_2897 [Sporocytophaga myxococcoides]
MNNIKNSIRTLFNLSEEEVTIFLSEFNKEKIKKNEVFIAEGGVCHKIGLIESGLMMCVYNKNGNEIIEEFAFENSFITNYYSYLTFKPSQKEIRCIEDTTVYVITRPGLDKLGTLYPFIRDMARKMNEMLFLRNHDRVKSLLLDTPAERYLQLISQKKDLAQRLPQYLIASYLGVAPETVSRIRNKMSTGHY